MTTNGNESAANLFSVLLLPPPILFPPFGIVARRERENVIFSKTRKVDVFLLFVRQNGGVARSLPPLSFAGEEERHY